MTTIRVAMLGAGNMARIHAKNLQAMEDVEVVAVCGISMEEAETFKGKSLKDSARCYCNFDKMLEECSMDALYICLPPFAHNGQLEKAAGQGIHIFIEKPIALSMERAASMLEAVKRNSVKSQVGYHMRFGSAVSALSEIIRNGTAGEPVLFNGRYECNALHGPWWRDMEKSGGQILEQVIHTYDMAIYLMGEPVDAKGYTSNVCHKNVPGYTVEDASAAVIRFSSGALASITGTNCAVPRQWNNPFTVVYRNLTAHFTDANHAEFIYTDKDPVKSVKVDGNCDMYFEEDHVFISALRETGPNVCTLEAGYQSLQLIHTVLQSSQTTKKSP